MAPVECIDKTGQPRTEEDLKEALEAVKKEIVKADLSNPTFFLLLPVIKDALQELLRFRQVIEKLKRGNKNGTCVAEK